MSKFNVVGVWDVSFYLMDENGDELVHKDGDIVLFDAPDHDVITGLTDWLEPEDLQARPQVDVQAQIHKLRKELAYYKLYHDDYRAWLDLKHPDEEEEEDEYDIPQAIDDMYLGMKD